MPFWDGVGKALPGGHVWFRSANTTRRFRSVASWASKPPRDPADHFTGTYGDDQHHALEDVLRERLHPEQVEPVAENADDQHPDDRPDHRALAPGKGRSAEDDRDDDIEFEPDARIRIAGCHAGIDQDPGDPGGQTREHIQDR